MINLQFRRVFIVHTVKIVNVPLIIGGHQEEDFGALIPKNFNSFPKIEMGKGVRIA